MASSSSSYYFNNNTTTTIQDDNVNNMIINNNNNMMTAATERVVIVMVGLPARGKSYLSKQIIQHFQQQQQQNVQTKIFNAGNVRRQSGHAGTDSSFFNVNNNTKNNNLREQIAMNCLDELLMWITQKQSQKQSQSSSSTSSSSSMTTSRSNSSLLSMASSFDSSDDLCSLATSTTRVDEDFITSSSNLSNSCSKSSYIGILDATNTTKKRRKNVIKKCYNIDPSIKVIFIECIVNNNNLLEQHYRMKLINDDYRNWSDPNIALIDFRNRVKQYELIYEPLGSGCCNSTDTRTSSSSSAIINRTESRDDDDNKDDHDEKTIQQEEEEEEENNVRYVKVINCGEQLIYSNKMKSYNNNGSYILYQVQRLLDNIHQDYLLTTKYRRQQEQHQHQQEGDDDDYDEWQLQRWDQYHHDLQINHQDLVDDDDDEEEEESSRYSLSLSRSFDSALPMTNHDVTTTSSSSSSSSSASSSSLLSVKRSKSLPSFLEVIKEEDSMDYNNVANSNNKKKSTKKKKKISSWSTTNTTTTTSASCIPTNRYNNDNYDYYDKEQMKLIILTCYIISLGIYVIISSLFLSLDHQVYSMTLVIITLYLLYHNVTNTTSSSNITSCTSTSTITRKTKRRTSTYY